MNFQIAVIALLLLIVVQLIALWLQGKRSRATIAALGDSLHAQTQKESRGLFASLETYLSLRDRLDLRLGLPYSHNWSAAPDFLKLIVEHTLSAKPATIVECSSGLTSLMLARCCQMNGHGALFSLENGPEFAAKTRSEIARYQLDDYATIIDAPLTRLQLDGREYQWYTLDDFPSRSIDMLVIDGPPGFIQHHSRYPALPLLFDKLAEGCVIFMDDAARSDEQEIIEMWRTSFPTIEHEYIKTERGCSIVRIRRGQS